MNTVISRDFKTELNSSKINDLKEKLKDIENKIDKIDDKLDNTNICIGRIDTLIQERNRIDDQYREDKSKKNQLKNDRIKMYGTILISILTVLGGAFGYNNYNNISHQQGSQQSD